MRGQVLFSVALPGILDVLRVQERRLSQHGPEAVGHEATPLEERVASSMAYSMSGSSDSFALVCIASKPSTGEILKKNEYSNSSQ